MFDYKQKIQIIIHYITLHYMKTCLDKKRMKKNNLV